MANKSCSATVSFAGWTLVGAGCTFDSISTIDGTQINNSVSFNNTMTGAQIATLYNSNRINNTTGTFTANIVGNALEITLTGVVLASGATGNFGVGLTTGSPFPCSSFIGQSALMTCSIIPNPKHKKKVGVPAYPATFCMSRFDRFGNPTVCKEIFKSGNATYQRISMNDKVCCYKRIA